jgi:DNA-binding NarL/FixJ family response regulator
MAEIIVVGGDGNRTPLEHALKSMSQHLFRADSFERLVRALEILQGDPNSRRHAAELEDSLRGLTTRVSDIDPLSTGLTAREQEIFRAISAGLSNKEIANLLSISTNTVKNHVHSILTKLNVSRRHYVLGHIYIDRFFQALRLCRHPKSQVCEKLPV